MKEKKRTNERLMAIILIGCIVIVGFWEVASHWSERSRQPFSLTAADLEDFQPKCNERFSIERLPVTTTVLDPDIAMYKVTGEFENRQRDADGAQACVIVRLVHGYNMVDCMRIKGYTVEEVSKVSQQNRLATSAKDQRVQIWRITSATGDVSIWATSMLRAGDFSMTGIDVRDMKFPRIGVPDDPSWMPKGFKLSGLRHPVLNMKWYFRAKWNNSRCDIFTFLKLRQPTWASTDSLTYVTAWRGASIKPENETRATAELLEIHNDIYQQMRQWRKAK